MQYYVLAPSGEKYGPVSLEQLQGWVNEKRVKPAATIEFAATGQQVLANQVPGLVFGAAPVTPPPPVVSTPNPYVRPTHSPKPGVLDDLFSRVSVVWFALLGICLAPLIVLLSVVALFTSKAPSVRQKAWVSFGISFFVFAIQTGDRLAGGLMR